MRVAYQGEPGAFSEEAALRLWPDADLVACHTLEDVFEAAASGRVDGAAVPVENSQGGSINRTYDLLRSHALEIVGEAYVPVEQCLLAQPGTALSEVKRVLSHPAALKQCQAFVEDLGAEAVAVHDTAGAARIVAEEKRPGDAAIASRRAAALNGLEVIGENVQTVRENATRFLALSRKPLPRGEGSQRTAIVFATDDRPGALYRALGAFAERGVNLLKLESRPSRQRPFEYVFYMDFEGHRDDPPVREALAALSRSATFLRVLGSFPRADNGR